MSLCKAHLHVMSLLVPTRVVRQMPHGYCSLLRQTWMLWDKIKNPLQLEIHLFILTQWSGWAWNKLGLWPRMFWLLPDNLVGMNVELQLRRVLAVIHDSETVEKATKLVDPLSEGCLTLTTTLFWHVPARRHIFCHSVGRHSFHLTLSLSLNIVRVE